MNYICPLCGEPLYKNGGAMVCPRNHSFDIARQGYVNLLPVTQKHSLQPGDTREQVLSRREFLDGGFYAPISDTLNETAKKYGVSGELLDVGCGEGYYAARLAQALNCPLTGLDISKEAVRCAAGRYKGHQWLCATAAHIPVESGSVRLLTSLFALTLPQEFSRVLEDGGLYFQILAAEDHLLGLKSIIYPELHHKEKDTVPELPGFTRLESIPIRFSFTVEGRQVRNLLSMTPHIYRVSKEGLDRLSATERLTDTASCMLNVFRKNLPLGEGGSPKG